MRACLFEVIFQVFNAFETQCDRYANYQQHFGCDVRDFGSFHIYIKYNARDFRIQLFGVFLLRSLFFCFRKLNRLWWKKIPFFCRLLLKIRLRFLFTNGTPLWYIKTAESPFSAHKMNFRYQMLYLVYVQLHKWLHLYGFSYDITSPDVK